MKKNRKKGFTLVEVIVVLVILAILAALMIPALTGWIDRANEKSAIVEARQVLLAAQTVASENYLADTDATSFTAAQITEVFKLAETPVTTFSTDAVLAGGKVQSFGYTTKGKVVTYTVAGGFVVADA